MADQDNQQPSLFHEIGSYMADAYQKFLDSKSDYAAQNPQQSPESINRGEIPTQTQDNQPVIGTGAQPISLTPQEYSQLNPQEQQQMNQSMPQQPQQLMQAPNSVTQAQPSIPQPMPQQPDAGQGSQGLPGAVKAQSNLANAAQESSKGIQDTYDSGLESQKQLVDQTQQHFQANQAQDQQLMNAYMNKQIDPNHVINNMSTGSKIMTTLGLLFSGIGSGLTGQKNLALEMINNNIARDLEAQKSEQGKAYNAYQMHREGTKDQFTADLQHQKDNMIAIDAAIEQQKAKLMGPQAVANATQTQLSLRHQILDLNQKQAMWTVMQNALKNPAQDPAGKIRQMQLTGQLNPSQAEQAFKEVDRVSNHAKQKEAIMESFDQANQENTIAGRAAHLGSTPASVSALQNQVMPYLKDAEGRINETEIKRLDSLIPAPGDAPHKVATKRKALQDFIEEKSGSSLLKGLGVNTEQSQSLKQQPTQKSKSGRDMFKNSQGQWEYK